VGGEVRGNYATYNPLSKASVATLSNGNLDASFSGSSYPHLGADATIVLPTSGKWYWEITATTVGELWTGIRNVVDGKQSTYYRDGSGGFNNIRIEASSSPGSANAASYTSGDIIGVAVNCDGSTIAWYKNGSQVGTTYSLTNVANLVPFAGHASSSGSAAVVANFGQRPFAYTAPSGFKALCTANLPAPLITKPSTVMDVALYTGNGSTKTISGLGFSPDFVWIKDRSQANGHGLFDVIRGTTKGLFSNLTNAEVTDSNSLTAFNSDGFTSGSGGTTFSTNINGNSYVSWLWDAGSSTVTNTSGSITSTVNVRANATAGFSIVTYAGASGGGSWGHGLGVEPKFIIFKRYTSTQNWFVFHKTTGSWRYFEGLNNTNADSDYSSSMSASSTIVTLPNITEFNTGVGSSYLAYCFAPVVGYNSISRYTGNGSSDGVFVYTGHRVRWLMIKRTDASDSWQIMDAARSDYNVADDQLYADLSNAEATTSSRGIDFLSNGFKIRGDNSGINASGGTYVYVSFAESPFQYARGR
jgi:hypothetical protein